MASKRDYYEILGITDKNADEGAIKKAFRSIAFNNHPDRNPSPEAAEIFREAQEAYEVLSDPQKRSIYDRFGHDGLSGRSSGFGGGDPGDVFAGFQSIFDDFFGGSGQRQRERGRGSDLLYRLEIDFRDAVLGCKKVINIPRHGACESCDGHGYEKGTKPETCGMCRGRGKVTQNQGFFVLSQTCPQCRGQGSIIRNPCKTCRGQGVKREDHKLEVIVPAGVDTGVRLRLSQEGELEMGASVRGDLYVEITVRRDEQFERDGADLYTRVTVPFTTVVLGGEITVPLIEGSKVVSIPGKTQTPHTITLKNEGVKDLRRNHRGNLHVEIQVETPQAISSRAKELLEELRSELGDPAKESVKEPKKKKKKSFFSI